MSIVDPFVEGMQRGWRVVDASSLESDLGVEADVAIVGTGAGGGIAAEALAEAGLSVVLIEEGPLASTRDFRMREGEAYPMLYHESGARRTRDKAITILQGRCVGGGTTVNWTSSFRTPPRTLAHWRDAYGITGFSPDDLAPWFEAVEERLSIAPWLVTPNANNGALLRGARKLGIGVSTLARNVRHCWDLGYCGLGCPINAKQSMLVTTIPAALDRGATLVTRARAWKLAHRGESVDSLECLALDPRGIVAGPRRVIVRARTYVLAAGAIGSPALLLRSGTPDPRGLVGRRTFLHPTVVSTALMPDFVDGHAGAPQSIYSDHYLDTLALDGPIGFKLEVAPMHPMLMAITLQGYGPAHAAWMARLRHAQGMLALLRDGFHPDSEGGRVTLRDDGSPVLDYPLTDYVREGIRRAYSAMAEIQFAAGAREVLPIHEDAQTWTSLEAARSGIAALAVVPMRTRVVSAHVMGGAPMGPDPERAVVNLRGRHHQLANLYVLDGSLFPTSIGANPQLSIYAVVRRLADGLARSLVPERRSRGADAPLPTATRAPGRRALG